MTTTEIRARVHAALEEPIYPAPLGDRIARRLSEPDQLRAFGPYRLAAGVLAILVIAALLLSRFLTGPLIGYPPTPAFKSNQVVGPVDPGQKLPAEDLAVAGLSGPRADLVTRLNLTAVSNGITVKVIGAYADTAQVVLFFRGDGQMFSVQAEVSDATGLLNYGSGGVSGIPGDWIVVLMGGAHPDTHGIAHLNVAVGVSQTGPGEPGVEGTWNFSFDVKVQVANALTLTPPLRSIGASRVIKIEAVELTPSVVHFQVLVGASPSQVDSWTVSLVDSSGHEVQNSSGYSELTNATFFFLVIGSPQTRVNVIWARPPPGEYELRISARGSEYRASLTIP